MQRILTRARMARIWACVAGVCALPGLISCVMLPNPSIKDYQAQIDAAVQASRQADEQEERALSQASGLVAAPPRHTADGIEVVLTTGHTGAVRSVGLSADDRYIVSSDGKEVKIWDAASHNEVRTFAAIGIGESSLRLSPDGKRLLGHDRLGEVRLFDCTTGKELRSASLISDDARISVSNSTSLGRMASAARPGLTITDLATDHQSDLPSGGAMKSLALSAHGDTLLTNEFETTVGAGSVVKDVVGVAAGVAAAVIPGVGTLGALGADTASDAIPTGSDERLSIVAWDVRTRRKLLTVRSSRLSNLAAINMDGRLLVVEGSDRSVDAYELPSGHKRRVVQPELRQSGPGFNHDALLLTADGRLLARVAQNGLVDIYDTSSGQKLAAFVADAMAPDSDPLARVASQSTVSAQFSPNGKLLAVIRDQQVHVWEIASRRTVLQLPASSIAFGANGRTAVIGRLNESAPTLLDLSTGKEETFVAHLDAVAQVDVTSDGTMALATAVSGSGKIWNLTTGQLAGSLPTCQTGARVMSVRASPTESLVASKCEDGSAELWDPMTQQRIQTLNPPIPGFASRFSRNRTRSASTYYYGLGEDVHFSVDGRLLAIATGEQVNVWDVATHVRVAQVSTADLPIPPAFDQTAALRRLGETPYIGSAVDQESLDSLPKSQRELLAAMNEEGQASAGRLREMSSPDLLEWVGEQQLQIGGVAVDANHQRLALTRSGEVSLWDLNTGQRIRVLSPPGGNGRLRIFGNLRFSVDGRVLYGPNGIRWELASGEASQVPAADTKARTPVLSETPAEVPICCDAGLALSPDGRFLARSVGLLVKLSDAATGLQLADLAGHTGPVTSVAYSRDGKTLLSGSQDGSVRMWDVVERKEIIDLYALGGADYIAVTPDEYYRASKTRLTGISFRTMDQLYPFEQFDLRFNRPDIVVERLGRASPAEIAEYRLARERRLRKMGFTESTLTGAFHLPEVQILGDEPPANTVSDTFSLRLKASDPLYALDRINVFVNDVPIFGSSGLPATDRQSHSEERQIVVPLVPGANKIQVSALNQQGVESLKRTLYTQNTAAVTHAGVYVVAIGVSSYKNPKYNLKFAAKDASDVMSLYGNTAANFASDQVHLLDLTNEKATRAGFASARDWLKQTHPNDLVVVFAAGHGVTDVKDNYYFGTYDIDPAQPQINGVPYEEFEKLLDGIPALKKLLLLDTCFSGEIETDTPASVVGAATSADGIVKMRAFQAMRGVAVVADPTHHIAVSSSPAASVGVGVHHFENLFADLRRGTGAVVISSASGNEYALEGDKWNNGVFAYAVLKGLKDRRADANQDGVVSVGELQAFVIDEVRRLTAGGQNPTVRQENLDFDFQIY